MKSLNKRCMFALAVVLPLSVTLGHALRGGRTFLGDGLHPEVVASTLARVQEEWTAQAARYLECKDKGGTDTCSTSQQTFGKSCGKVVDSIVQGSSGDQDRVREYMNVVCAQKALSSEHHEHCLELQKAIDGALQFNPFSNRLHFDSTKLCGGFWSKFVTAEGKRRVEQQKAEKEMLLKANEEAAKAAEKQKHQEAQRKAIAEQKKAREAKEQAEQARKEASEESARKKAEAESLAVAAKAAMERRKKAAEEAQERVRKAAAEAEEAAEEHKKRQLEHEKAQAQLRKITEASNKVTGTAATPKPVAMSVHASSSAAKKSTWTPTNSIITAPAEAVKSIVTSLSKLQPMVNAKDVVKPEKSPAEA